MCRTRSRASSGRLRGTQEHATVAPVRSSKMDGSGQHDATADRRCAVSSWDSRAHAGGLEGRSTSHGGDVELPRPSSCSRARSTGVERSQCADAGRGARAAHAEAPDREDAAELAGQGAAVGRPSGCSTYGNRAPPAAAAAVTLDRHLDGRALGFALGGILSDGSGWWRVPRSRTLFRALQM